MTHKYRHKQLQRIKQKYKNLAAIVAAATILSTTALLPGIPIATAHASSTQATDTISATTSQGVGKTTTSSLSESKVAQSIPTTDKTTPQKTIEKVQSEDKAPKPTEKAQSEDKTPKPTEKVQSKDKTPKPTEKVQPEDKAPKSSPNSDKKTGDSPPTDYKKVLDIAATAYAPGPHDNDQWGNKTYIGSQVRPGIIAVDPKIIPLGSRVYIEYPDGHGEYATAEDTGGAIKGNRVDVAKWTVDEAEKFGIQNVKVYIVSTPEKV